MCRPQWKFQHYPTLSDKRWPRLSKLCSSFVILGVGQLTQWLLRRHSLLAVNLPKAQAVRQRLHSSKSRSLVTVMNHSATWDDLLVTGLLATSLSQFFNPEYMRLTPVAADICFTKNCLSKFFSLGNCVPAHRTVRDPETGNIRLAGHGVYQESFNFLVSELNRGGRWVNILPQGRVIVGADKARETQIRFYWGVGRLIADAEPTPLVLPIWHEGIEAVNPLADGQRGYFRAALEALWRGPLPVTVNFGEPLDLAPLVQRLRREGASPKAIRMAITDELRAEMMRLRADTIQLHEQRL